MEFKLERFFARRCGAEGDPCLHFSKRQAYFDVEAVAMIKGIIRQTPNRVVFFFDKEKKVLAFCFIDGKCEGSLRLSVQKKDDNDGIRENWKTTISSLYERYPIISLLAQTNTDMREIHKIMHNYEEFEGTQMFAVDFNKESIFDKRS